MAAQTETQHEEQPKETDTDHPAWIGGLAGGLAGGAVMGVMLSIMLTPVIQHAIPALWGLDGGVAGWIVHMSNSAIFGVVFAAFVTQTTFRTYEQSLGRSVGLGLMYGVVLWIIAAGIVMPIWLQTVGFPMAPPFPNFNPMSLPGHLVYGAVLGAVYPYVSGYSSDQTDATGRQPA